MNKEKKYEFNNFFIGELRDLAGREYIGSIYLHLFKLLSDEELEEEILYLYNLYKGDDEYFKDYGKENWFYLWHKSVRQVDYFHNLKGYRIENKLNEVQNSELKKLRNELEDLYEKNVYKLTRERDSEEDYKKHEDSLKSLDSIAEYNEIRKKISTLKKIENTQVDIRLGGVADSILWNTVHLDKDDRLYKVFMRTFNEIDIQKQLKKIENEQI